MSLIELNMQRNAFADAISTARSYLETNQDSTVRRLLGLALQGRKQRGGLHRCPVVGVQHQAGAVDTFGKAGLAHER